MDKTSNRVSAQALGGTGTGDRGRTGVNDLITAPRVTDQRRREKRGEGRGRWTLSAMRARDTWTLRERERKRSNTDELPDLECGNKGRKKKNK